MRVMRLLRQQYREQPNDRQKRAHVIHGCDPVPVSELAQHRRAQTGDAEREAKEQPGDEPDTSGQQLLRVHKDRGER